MKKIINIFIVLIFAFSFISCKQERYEQLSQEELSEKLYKAIDEENWNKVDAIMPFIADKPEIFQIIDNNDIEKLKEKINQTTVLKEGWNYDVLNEKIYLKMYYDKCLGEKVIPSVTPFAYAVKQNKTEIVKFLLSQNIDEDAIYREIDDMYSVRVYGKDSEDDESWFSENTLFMAVLNRNKEMVNLLIKNYKDPIGDGKIDYTDFIEYSYSGYNCKNYTGYPILMESIEWGDKEILSWLLQNIKQRDLLDKNEISALLNFAKDEEIKKLIVNANKKAVEEIIGEDFNAKDEKGQTPLHIAAENDDSFLIKILLDYGADINAKDNEDLTPLYYAIDNWNEKDGVYQDETIEFLISKGADVNVQDKEGRTLLHIATEGTASSVVDLLISKGVDVNAKDKRGETPLDYAIRKQKKFEENHDMLSRLIDFMYGRIKYIKKHLIEVGAKSGKDLK